jgi:hypothetical protein
MWRKNVQSNGWRMVDVSNMERDIAITRTNYRHFHCSSFYNREFIIVICRKSVLIDTFVLDEIIRVVAEMAISA